MISSGTYLQSGHIFKCASIQEFVFLPYISFINFIMEQDFILNEILDGHFSLLMHLYSVSNLSSLH